MHARQVTFNWFDGPPEHSSQCRICVNIHIRNLNTFRIKFRKWQAPFQLPKLKCHSSRLCSLKMAAEYELLEMWANAQRDGRPAEYRWRPLFNAAKFS